MNIKEIAEIAGVSVSTVSKIVNKKDGSISQATREKVLQIVKEYNYSPYSSRINTQNSTRQIGLLLNSTSNVDLVLKGMLKESQLAGYQLSVFDSCNSSEQELKNITSICQAKFDGLIWEPVSKESFTHSKLLDQAKIPFLTFGYLGQDRLFSVLYQKIAYRSVESLLEYKHKAIACLTADSKNTPSFIEGYKSALFNNHLPLNKKLIFSKINHQLIHDIKNRKFSGIIVEDYQLALEIYNIVLTLHKTVPEDLSIITQIIQSDTYSNNISAYSINHIEIGTTLSKKIINLIENKKETFSNNFISQSLTTTHTINVPFDQNVPKITVIGSIHLDTYLNTPEIPKKEETIILSNISTLPGGKALNQAIGIAKLGKKVNLIGKIGSDIDKDIILKELQAYNIKTSGILTSETEDTGKAFIFVQEDGESMISILPGANNNLNKADIEVTKDLFTHSNYCLLQTEIPISTIDTICQITNSLNIKTVLKPSLKKNIPTDLLKKIDILIPNYDELLSLCPDQPTLEKKAEALLNLGIETIIVTLGKRGCYLRTKSFSKYFSAPNFNAVNTTGAGDAFISAFISYLSEGFTLVSAVEIAVYAASFSTTRDGVITSLIDKQTLESYVARLKQNNEIEDPEESYDA